jgi:hypothetical protein
MSSAGAGCWVEIQADVQHWEEGWKKVGSEFDWCWTLDWRRDDPDRQLCMAQFNPNSIMHKPIITVISNC